MPQPALCPRVSAVGSVMIPETPGPDGYTAKFYKKAWPIVGRDVCNAIKEFFRNGRMLGEINATLITLVPKSSTPQKVSDYRPIACCNVLYKIIIKILKNRIKHALGKLANPSQSAFIPGRQITDNIILVRKRIKAGRPYISLHFRPSDGNNLLVLCYGDLNSVQVIKRAMETFSSISGLNPNIGKSTIFFGNVQEQVKQAILSILPFKVGSLPVSYLGVPLITKQLSFTDCKYLIDRVKAKVNNWMNKMLSYVGRLQLITSILSSMRTFKRKSQNSLETVTMKESIWVQWVNNNRLKGSSIWEIECDNNASSGDGSSIFLWHDKWWGPEPISKLLSMDVVIKEGLDSNAKIKDMIIVDKWRWPRALQNNNVLNSIPVPKLRDGVRDTFLWNTKDGKNVNYSTNKAWKDWKNTCDKVNWHDFIWEIFRFITLLVLSISQYVM
ncbi:RNA-directed DNA polymerase, eukaryota, reverse transcriptase zinc-binding domain protein [Tanacetum coccineum]